MDFSKTEKQTNMQASNNQKVQLKAFPVPGCVAADHPQPNALFTEQEELTKKSYVKKRQKTPPNRKEVVEKYKTDVEDVWERADKTVNTWFGEITLECKLINPQQLPIGFVKTGTDKYQYRFTDPEPNEGSPTKPCAYRIPFITQPGYEDKGITVSHLCHDNRCYNWDHHVFESLAINKSRNGCPAGEHCHHKTKCLIPGEFFDQ